MAEAPPRKRRFSRLLLLLAGFLALLVMLAFETAPDTKVADAPDAGEVQLARDGFDRLRKTLKPNEAVDFTISEPELDAGFKLAARSRNITRSKASISSDAIDGQISLPWRFGLWINLKGHVEESASGFPEVSARIGDLPIPAFLCKLAIKLYWNSRDADMPLLDDLAQKLTLKKGEATARVKLPKKSNLLNTLGAARANAVDPELVSKIYCKLTKAHADAPSNALARHVRRAFAGGDGSVERNRAAFVALAMFVADRRVGEVAAGLKLDETAKCRIDRPEIMLLGRGDLAKHWAISAAVTAAFGADMSVAMGTWKEIADSGRGGSGFSLVDLAADRSGVLNAARATDSDTATKTARRLSKIDEDDLLPVQALALSEGMSEAEFQSRYVSTEAKAYQKVVARIDRILAKGD
jgi:uncharacterized protein YfiM (DUF2279 family)